MKNSFENAVRALPAFIRSMLCSLPRSITDEVTELRLRAGRPIVLVSGVKTYFLSRTGVHSKIPASPYILTQKELDECFVSLCDYSVYSRQSEICEGFITVRGGSRAGICGTAVCENGRIVNVKNISSINLRVAREIYGCSADIINRVKIDDGLLLCGAPCSGKTTVLRDIARLISRDRRVSLIDSRGEIAAAYRGVPQNDIGLCDVLDGYSRRDGFEIAVRCFSPEIVVCDEIGSRDIPSLINASLSGALVVATAHSKDERDFRKKEGMMKMIETGVFRTVVFLGVGNNVGKAETVLSAEEILA